jgi:hypothetical protein
MLSRGDSDLHPSWKCERRRASPSGKGSWGTPALDHVLFADRAEQCPAVACQPAMSGSGSVWNALGGSLAALGALLALVRFVMMVRRFQRTGAMRERSVFADVEGRTRNEWIVLWTSRGLLCVGLILLVI